MKLMKQPWKQSKVRYQGHEKQHGDQIYVYDFKINLHTSKPHLGKFYSSVHASSAVSNFIKSLDIHSI